MNFYPHHIGDYKSATAHLSNDEDLAYRRLLEVYYDTESPIPAGVDLGRKLRLPPDTISIVLQEFFALTEHGWTHVRCEKEIAAYQAMKRGGKIGSDKRWGKGDYAPPIPTLSPTLSHPNANHEPLTKNQEPIEVPKGTCPPSRTPSQQLLDLFHEKCTFLPRVTVFNDNRRRTLQGRFKEVMASEKWTTEQTIEWFSEFYGIVNQSKFLTGRAQASKGGRVFKADWDWVHGPQNFVKIVEGKYSGE